jgi:hypothetical protein
MTRIPASAAAVTICALLCTTAAGAANFSPIDDFEVGNFSLSGSTDTAIPIPGYWSHAIWTERNIYMSGANPTASLSVSSIENDAMELSLRANDLCRVEYRWGFPKDLSFAGTVERIEVRVKGPFGAAVGAVLTNGTSTAGAPGAVIFGTGISTVSWPITQWAPSLTSVATGFWIVFSEPGDYEIYDIRFRTWGSSPVDFTGDFTATAIPPVPSSPLQYRAFDELGNVLYRADVAIGDATTDAQTVPGGDWTWSETAALGGEAATSSFQWTDFGGIMETYFDVSVGVSAADGYLPDLFPPDPVHGPESIALAFPVVMRDGNGAAQGVSNTWLTFDFDERQLGSLEFQEVSVVENPVARSWTDGFTLRFRMAFSGMNSPDETFPLFHATWMSDWTTQVPTGTPGPNGPPAESGGRLELIAVPGVTRWGTEIRASRPFGAATELLVHDVTGRVVRSLPAAAGSRSVRWDGRGPTGAPLGSGVYFFRTAETGSTGRVVLVR